MSNLRYLLTVCVPVFVVAFLAGTMPGQGARFCAASLPCAIVQALN